MRALTRNANFAKVVGEPAREGQLIERMDPVRPCIVELPIGVNIALLHGVVGSHALLNRDDVGLYVREMVKFVGKVYRVAIDGDDVTWNIVAHAHSLQYRGVGG